PGIIYHGPGSIHFRSGGGMKEGSIRTVVVVGAGIMGRGIALASARAGFKTSVIEPNSAVIESARGEIDKILDRAREKNEIDEAGARAALYNLSVSGSY